MTAPVPRPRVAVVVGSGGLKCAASIGLWRVLQRERIAVDLFVGCSGGSLYTTCMALGYDADHIEDLSMRMWMQGLPRKLHYPTVLRTLLPNRIVGARRRIGLLDDSAFVRTVAAAIDDARFSDTVTPLHLLATDIETGERVVLSEGPIAEAIRASVAIPIWFRPWEVGGRLLVDGGLSDPMPVSVAIQERCDVIIAMGFEQPRFDMGSMLGLIGQVTSVSMNNLLKATFAFYSVAHHAEVVPILPVLEGRIALGDTDRMPYIIRQGEEAAEAEMPYIRRLLEAAQPAVAAR